MSSTHALDMRFTKQRISLGKAAKFVQFQIIGYQFESKPLKRTQFFNILSRS